MAVLRDEKIRKCYVCPFGTPNRMKMAAAAAVA
jgi:hypothetical protein